MNSVQEKEETIPEDALQGVVEAADEQRLLNFLNLLCTKNLDYVDDNLNQFVLPMAKSDIANYLGMRPESISRALRQLESQGLVKNNTNGKLTIINKEKILSEVMKISA